MSRTQQRLGISLHWKRRGKYNKSEKRERQSSTHAFEFACKEARNRKGNATHKRRAAQQTGRGGGARGRGERASARGVSSRRGGGGGGGGGPPPPSDERRRR